MMRLRSADGRELQTEESVAAVEICSSDGKLCRVLIPNRDGSVVTLDPDDEDFQAYAKMLGLKQAQLFQIQEGFIEKQKIKH